MQRRDQRLVTLSVAFNLDPVPIDQRGAEESARLRVVLRDMGKRTPVKDSWIAAPAISLGVSKMTTTWKYHDSTSWARGTDGPKASANRHASHPVVRDSG